MNDGHSDRLPEAVRDLSFEDLVQCCIPLLHDQVAGLEDLLAGVEYDLEEVLPESFVAPWDRD